MIEKDIDKKYEMVVVAEPAAILLALSYQAMRELMKIVHEMRPDSDIRVFEYKGTDEGNQNGHKSFSRKMKHRCFPLQEETLLEGN